MYVCVLYEMNVYACSGIVNTIDFGIKVLKMGKMCGVAKS